MFTDHFYGCTEVSNNSNSVTYTLRLPEALKTRMETSADNRKISLNQLILDIIDQHYKAAGLTQGTTISTNGRTLEIRVKQIQHPPGMPMCNFYLDDAARGMEVACYTLGFSSQFMWQLQVVESQQYQAIAEIGMALLHFFNRQGLDITRLEWTQFPTIDTRRVLQMQDAKTRTGVFIRTVEQFSSALQEDLWLDRLMNVLPSNRLDGRAIDAALVTLQQNRELKMEKIVDFEPTKRFPKVEEAIEEAVAKAREKQCTFRFDCNDFIMLIDASSDVNTLIDKYWQFKHNEGLANGTIVPVPFDYPNS
jgi:hypothetical protein